jgi:high-affinity iron transporter
MLAGYLLALREGVEAAFVIGLLLTGLRRLCRGDCAAAVWIGVAAGLVVSVTVALLLRAVGWNLEGTAEAIFEGAMGLLAAALLGVMILWMHRTAGRVGAAWEAEIKDAVGSGRGAVFAVAFITVTREGVELALFLAAASLESHAVPTLAGAAAGLGTAAVAGWALFATAVRFSLRRFFQVTNVLLLLFAAGLVAKGVGEFGEAGWIPPMVDPLWNTSRWLPETSASGAVLKTLLGYNSTPSFMQVLSYAGFLAIVGWLLSRTSAEPARGVPAASQRQR